MKDITTVHVVGAAILNDGRCLVAQRGLSMSMAGKWEFPGGKVERGEAPEAALARELREELGIEAVVGRWLGRGDSIENGRRVCLDVYLAKVETRSMNLHEHAAAEWVRASDLHARDWAKADIPILPALHAHMASGSDQQRCGVPVALLAADWGKDARKRAVYVAESIDGWVIARLSCPEGWTVSALLDVAREMRTRSGSAVLVGIDVSLGIPTALARQTGSASFIDFLVRSARTGGLEKESRSAAGWRPEAPFFRIPSGSGAKHAFFQAAGGESALLRQIDSRTGANPTFALSGIPGTVGSGSRSVWRELAHLLVTRDEQRDFRIWPFEGSLASLLAENAVVLAEIYPKAAYALALADELPAPPESIAKTRRAAREGALRQLESARWVGEANVSLPDLSPARGCEDDFDALLTVAAMTRATTENRPLSCSLVDPMVEGGMIATGDITIPSAPYWKRRRSIPRRARAGRENGEGMKLRCPVPGCSKTFVNGRSGWDSHAASSKIHPDWHPDLTAGDERKAMFRQEFAKWFAA